MVEQVVASGSENRKVNTKAPFYNWIDNQTMSLMHVLIEFHEKFGFNKLYDWEVINKAFFTKMEVDLTKHGKTIASNKVEHMKKLWRNWSDLRLKMSGVGWDKNTGMVTLLDDCWDSFKKSDNNKFLNFRTKGVDPKLCELWDEVFGSTMATGKNVMAPFLLKRKAIGNGKAPVINLENDRVDALINTQGTELDLLLDRELLDDDAAQRKLVSRVRPNAPFDECMDGVGLRELRSSVPLTRAFRFNDNKLFPLILSMSVIAEYRDIIGTLGIHAESWKTSRERVKLTGTLNHAAT